MVVSVSMQSRSIRLAGVFVSLLVAATACQTSEPSTGSSTTEASVATTSLEAFDDHTIAQVESREVFDHLASVEGSQAAVKFVIPDLSVPGVIWMDSEFYDLHDEWYWFRLLNGERVPGLPTEPDNVGRGDGFDTIDEIYDWADDHSDDLPLDLRFARDGRLYSEEYYELALRDTDKTYGLGTLIRYNTETGANDNSNGEHWVIQLEYNEATTVESVGLFFDRLAEALPPEIAENLEWVPRSAEQSVTARQIVASGNANRNQVVHYVDLVPQGEVTVYNSGITAGRLRLIEDDEDLNKAKSTDILVMENVPDWLPPASAILTSAPQTPLAHVNLLARNRGIPNVSISGLLDNPAITLAAKSRAYAVVSANASGELHITLITEEQFDDWAELVDPTQIVVPPIDMAATPTILSLNELAATIRSESDIAVVRSVIGGKSAGFLALIAADGVTMPDTPLAITVAPYFRHLEVLESELEAMLGDDDFQTHARIRFLLLEGAQEYGEVYPSEGDAKAAADFGASHLEGPLRTIIDADGFMNLLRDVDMADIDLDEITAVLTSTFAPLSDLQGLRFRSSSSVEDIEGFTGAGLYDSNTGFLLPQLQADEKDHKKTVERTIKKTWASYWSFEAFEERRLENVDHRSGGMAVLVHPRFDDALEVDNGVATLMLLPESNDDRAVLTINVQTGDTSVTNPEAGSDVLDEQIVLPEQIVVHVSDEGALQIERSAGSTLVPAGDLVMSDESVQELLLQLDAVAVLWRDRVNTDLEVAQQVDIVTLDFEFKHMAAGWPALTDGSELPSRLVVKQARSLDPDLRGVSDEALALAIPRDVLARASLVEVVTCDDGASGVEVEVSRGDGGDVLAPTLQFSDNLEGLNGDSCERTTLLSSPERLLTELLASGEGLQIG